MRHRQCFSLDDNVLHKPDQSTGFSEATSTALQGLHTAKSAQPIRPPYAAPERVRTPDGVPRWNGEVTRSAPLAVLPTSTVTLFRQLRTRGSQVFRSVFGVGAREPTPPVRRWRPPASGHMTPRYGELEMHPFARAQPAGRTAQGSQREKPIPLDRTVAGSHTPEIHGDQQAVPSSAAGQRVLSPSQRALQAVHDNAVPVSPRRAQAEAEASARPRSVSLPLSLRRSLGVEVVDEADPETSPMVPTTSDTLRTVDMIEQFPAPPDRGSSEQAVRSAGARMGGLFLFPSTEEGGSSAEHGRVSKKMMGRSKKERTSAPANGATTNDISIPPAAKSSGPINNTPNAAPEDEDDGPATHNIPDRSSIRGESSTRYRLSGTPIYDNDAASLRSFDRSVPPGDQIRPATLVSHPPLSRNGVVSALSGNSRYLSAASTALGTKAVAQSQSAVREQVREQERRALANGALRFSSTSRRDSGIENASPISVVRASDEEDANPTFPITPVTVTKASKIYCRHRIAELRQKEHLQNQQHIQNEQQQATALPASTLPQLPSHRPLSINLDGTSPTRRHRQHCSTDSSPISPLTTPIHTPPIPTPPIPTPPAAPPAPRASTSETRLRRLASRILNKPLPPIPLSEEPAEPVFPAVHFDPVAQRAQQAAQVEQAQPRHSVISFAARNHIRHHRHMYHRGTWRTRMKRTKCWRCGLESRRTRR